MSHMMMENLTRTAKRFMSGRISFSQAMSALAFAMALVAVSLMSMPLMAQSPEPHSIEQSASRISQADRALNQQRESEFLNNLDQRQQLLQRSHERLRQAEAEQERLKNAFDDNEVKLAEAEELLRQRTGQLGEVFGVAKETAEEITPVLADSMISAQYPGRTSSLDFADSKRVPTVLELEQLWFQLQREMTASGQIARFEAPLVMTSGETENTDVVRFGVFAAATVDGRYANWDTSQQRLQVLPVQPDSGELSALKSYLSGEADTMGEVLLDPSRGELFEMLGRMPSLQDRIEQGGEVGYFILALGAIGLLVAAWRLLMLLVMEMRVRSQLRNLDDARDNNPLGRILRACQETPFVPEQLEVKVDQALLQEIPRVERGQSIIKLLAAVAPLLGLLGTVIGMIATFQSITLFGTGDPKLMAGGISQALITTVLGLVVAVPLLFSHSLLATRGRLLLQLLQEKSLAEVERCYQQQHDKERMRDAA